ncbi:Uncharacterised protein [uncultured Comamonas sp.]|nr:Uncharacterised protein [uncultured Comamonas sp.]
MKYQQKGQSLVEFIVIAIALMPLLLLLPMIAKYQDISHTVQVGSRYAAFDATVNNDQTTAGFKPADDLAIEVRRRFFSNPDAPIKTKDAAGDFKAHQNLFWRDPADKPLIRKIDDIAVRVGPSQDVDTDRIFLRAGAFKLNDPPLYEGAIQVPLVNLPSGIRSYEPFDALDLRIGRKTVVMIGNWTGHSPSDVNQKVRASQDLTKALNATSSVMSLPFVLLELGHVSPPEVGKLERWEDLVPTDRLRARK